MLFLTLFRINNIRVRAHVNKHNSIKHCGLRVNIRNKYIILKALKDKNAALNDIVIFNIMLLYDDD